MITRVRFKDGTEVVQYWNSSGSPAAKLLTAVIDAEYTRIGEAHDGAWLEFSSDDPG